MSTHWYRVEGKPLQRLGVRGRMVEGIFARVPREYRSAEVFLAIADAAGVPEERAKAHWTARVAMLESNPPQGNRRGKR